MLPEFQPSDPSTCSAETALKIISGRWKLLILRLLFEEVKRFGELQKDLPGITQKVLTQQLRELELDGIVHRQVYAQIPPKVEYSLTPLGETLSSCTQLITQKSTSKACIALRFCVNNFVLLLKANDSANARMGDRVRSRQIPVN
jgi:DNA-binding HxlR family transcriptional regulator